MKRSIEAYFEAKNAYVRNAEPIQSAGFQAVMNAAVMQSQSCRKRRGGRFLISWFHSMMEERTYAGYLMRKLGIKRLQLLEVLSHV